MASLEAKLINFIQDTHDVTRHEAYLMAETYIALVIGQITMEAQCKSDS